MTRPLTIYLCTLSLTTSAVILAGTAAVPRRAAPVARAGGSPRLSDLNKSSALPGAAYLEPAAAGPWETWEATAYSHGCIRPRGPEGKPRKAADGRWPTPNWTVAAGPHYAFGTVLELSHGGIVTRRVVGDRGRAIQGRRLDLFVADCGRARAWGRRKVFVRVVRQPLGGINVE